MLVFKLVKIESGCKDVEVILNDDQLDSIYRAMSDYKDYGDEEADIANSIQDALSELFNN
jgi:hypothetical protein